jgi:hypothetical protein
VPRARLRRGTHLDTHLVWVQFHVHVLTQLRTVPLAHLKAFGFEQGDEAVAYSKELQTSGEN